MNFNTVHLIAPVYKTFVWIIFYGRNDIQLMEKVYTRKEAAELLGICPACLDTARMKGLIAYIQYVPNGKVYFTSESLEEYVARCTNRARPICENQPMRRHLRTRR